MHLAKARLVSRSSQDGVDFVRNEVPLGKHYWVDLDSIHERTWANTDLKIEVRRKTILSAHEPDFSDAGFMPLELLKIDTGAEA